MSDDLVERLRANALDECDEAIDRIEELEAKLKPGVLRQRLEERAGQWKKLEARAEDAEAKLAEADTRARAMAAAALTEAAGVCTGDEERPEPLSGAKLRSMPVQEQFAYEQKRLAWKDADEILALIDTDHAAALDKLITKAERRGMERAAGIASRELKHLDSIGPITRMILASIRAEMNGGEPVRCAECDCEGGGSDCNWIKGCDHE